MCDQQPQSGVACLSLGQPGGLHAACHWHWAGLRLTACGFMAA